jgi:hypothetical protein
MLCLVALTGCASAPESAGPALPEALASAGPPVDFALNVTILAGPAVNQPNDPPLRQSRYVLLADGSLCYGSDPERTKGADWLPPITRILTTGQIADVWSHAREGGLLDPLRANEPVNFKLVPPPLNDEVVYLAEFTALGQRWNFIRRATVHQGIDGPIDQALTQLIVELAELAWVDGQSASDVPIMPKRYDFGTDPYSRYRKQ